MSRLIALITAKFAVNIIAIAVNEHYNHLIICGDYNVDLRE